MIKHRLEIDDSLGVFAVHGVGGIVGTLLAVTFVIVKATGAMVGLRVDEDEIAQVLDLSAHGESGYSL